MWPIVRRPPFRRWKNSPKKHRGERWSQKKGTASRWETNQELGLRQLPSRQEVWYSFRPVSELTPHIFQILCFCLYRSSHLIYIKLFFKNFTVPFLYLIFYHTVMLKYYFFDFLILFCIFALGKIFSCGMSTILIFFSAVKRICGPILSNHG